MVLNYKQAKERLLTTLDDSCQQFFVKNAYTLENAYIKLLSDDLQEAKNLFYSIKDSDVRAHWALFMISLIEGDVKEYPSYFELRNFLEIDLNILIHYYKGDYVEKIVRYSDFMYSINPEVYKFIGRVLFNNGLKEHAMLFLNHAKNYFYNDPELHYLLAYIYYCDKNIDLCKKSLNDCLYILPNYYPAMNLIDKINHIKK